MPPREQQSVLWLLYDLERTPVENRITGEVKEAKSKMPGPGDSGYSSAITNVGFPIYPESNVENQSYEIRVASAEARHHRPGRQAGRGWYFDDTKLLFTDEVRGRQWLVLIDFSEGLQSVKIARRQIDVSRVLGSTDASLLLIEKYGEIRNGSVEVLLREEQARRYQKEKVQLRVP